MRTLEQMLEIAARHLPDGVEIEIRVERGYGEVFLIRNDVEIGFQDAESNLSDQMNRALSVAGLGEQL